LKDTPEELTVGSLFDRLPLPETSHVLVGERDANRVQEPHETARAHDRSGS
jgi:hypothetical protein